MTSPPDWQLPSGVSRGLWDYLHDPAIARLSPGVANVTRAVALAAERAIPHVYLGYRVLGCRSMRYKAAFQPHELLAGRPGPDEEPRWLAAPVVKALVGAEFTLTMSPQGEVSDVQVVDRSVAEVSFTVDSDRKLPPGAQFAIKTISQFTGLPINHVIVVDFNQFKDLIDKLGGIDIDVPKAIHSNRFDCDKSFRHHGIESRKESFNLFETIDDLDNHRQILRQAKNLGCVHHTVPAESHHTAKDSCAGQSGLSGFQHDGFIRRHVTMLVAFTHKDSK